MKSHSCLNMLFVCVVLLSVSVASFAETEDVQIGETTNDVITALGEPKGIIRSGAYQVLIYPRGEIVFRNGHATSVALLTPVEAQRKQAVWRRREAEWKRLQAVVAQKAAAEAAAKAAQTKATPRPAAVPKLDEAAPEMTEAEKREARIEELQVEIKDTEAAEKALATAAQSVRRRRELRVELSKLKIEQPAMPEGSDEEKAAKEAAAKRITSIETEISALGTQGARVRRRRELRTKLEKLRAELITLQ
jgi:hypothetical protein